MMRFLPSFAAVTMMSQGASPTEACERALDPVRKFYPSAEGALICVNAKGEIGGAKLNYASFSFSVFNDLHETVQTVTI